MFEMGFFVGLGIGILAMIFIPWKCCGRRNIKVAELPASTNKKSVPCNHGFASYNPFTGCKGKCSRCGLYI